MPVYPIQISMPNTMIQLWKIAETREELVNYNPLLQIPQQINHPAKILEFLASRLILSNILPGVEISKNDQGKPIANNESHASISHTKGWAAVCYNHSFPVGIDVEHISDKAFRLRKKFSQEQEWLALKKTTNYTDSVLFSVIWSVKEAVYKCLPHLGWVFSEDFFISSMNENNRSFTLVAKNKGEKMLHLKGVFEFIENIVLVVAITENVELR
jgi:4'-phosphopantetheinyl transferase EntD